MNTEETPLKPEPITPIVQPTDWLALAIEITTPDHHLND